jgi:hypothetical protein
MNPPPPVDFEVHQEGDDIATSTVVGAALSAAAIAALAVGFAAFVLVATTGALRPSAAGPGGPRPGPRSISLVEQTPLRDTTTASRLREGQRRDLERWGWIDRDAGVARIPVERAIDVVVSEQAR